MPEISPTRRKLGIALMVMGVVPWLGLSAYLVITKHATPLFMVAYLLTWAVFFIGKTLTKTPEPRFDPADGPPPKD